MNNLHLCKPIIRAIDSPHIDLNEFPNSEVVTYKFYCGHKAIYDGDFSLALQNLEYSFLKCRDTFFTNKRMILLLLLPLKLLNYNVPRADLLQKYKMTMFSELIQAIEEGNLVKFDEQVNLMTSVLIKNGLYIPILKLKIILIRNLFHRVYSLQNSHQIKLHVFEESYVFSKQSHAGSAPNSAEKNSRESLGYLVNLISMGLIKGYISDKHQVLVLSKANPFPDNVTIQVFETAV